LYLNGIASPNAIPPQEDRAAASRLPSTEHREYLQLQLADKAIVALHAVTRLEKGKVDQRVSTYDRDRRTFTESGNSVIEDGEMGESKARSIYAMLADGSWDRIIYALNLSLRTYNRHLDGRRRLAGGSAPKTARFI
jgi:hypothetical protein